MQVLLPDILIRHGLLIVYQMYQYTARQVWIHFMVVQQIMVESQDTLMGQPLITVRLMHMWTVMIMWEELQDISQESLPL